MKKFFFIVFFCSLNVFGQKNVEDSLKLYSHSPQKAAFWSVVIPGAGQIYNQYYSPKGRYGAYWKVPIIYASLALTGNLFVNSIQEEKEIRTEYNNRDLGKVLNLKWSNYTQSDLITLHESAVRKRTMFGLLFGGVYLIQVIEASVDAHFLHFDISPSISMRFQPTYYFQTAGVQLTVDIK